MVNNEMFVIKQKTAGGFRWAFCDKHGNIIEKESK